MFLKLKGFHNWHHNSKSQKRATLTLDELFKAPALSGGPPRLDLLPICDFLATSFYSLPPLLALGVTVMELILSSNILILTVDFARPSFLSGDEIM